MNIFKKVSFIIALTCAVIFLSIDYDRSSFAYGVVILAVGIMCGIFSAKIKEKEGKK